MSKTKRIRYVCNVCVCEQLNARRVLLAADRKSYRELPLSEYACTGWPTPILSVFLYICRFDDGVRFQLQSTLHSEKDIQSYSSFLLRSLHLIKLCFNLEIKKNSNSNSKEKRSRVMQVFIHVENGDKVILVN